LVATLQFEELWNVNVYDWVKVLGLPLAGVAFGDRALNTLLHSLQSGDWYSMKNSIVGSAWYLESETVADTSKSALYTEFSILKLVRVALGEDIEFEFATSSHFVNIV
jgi:hypothetical protein